MKSVILTVLLLTLFVILAILINRTLIQIINGQISGGRKSGKIKMDRTNQVQENQVQTNQTQQPTIIIRKIDRGNFEQVLQLDKNSPYTLTPIETLAGMILGEDPQARAIYLADDELIGLVLWDNFKDGLKIRSFMLDKHYQGKGLAKPALLAVIAEMKRVFPGQTLTIYLSVDPANMRAIRVYESVGFKLYEKNNDSCRYKLRDQ